jgi:hypothetical protein
MAPMNFTRSKASATHPVRQSSRALSVEIPNLDLLNRELERRDLTARDPNQRIKPFKAPVSHFAALLLTVNFFENYAQQFLDMEAISDEV